MRGSIRAAATPAAVLLLTLTGCVGIAATPPVQPPDAQEQTAGDTARGTVAVVGADPVSQVVLSAGGERLVLEGEATVELRRVDGLDVRVRGERDGGRIRVMSFEVIGAHGLVATDGVLEVRGDTAVVVTAEGERAYAPVPSDLRQHEGERVWIAGPAGGEPQAWGVIAPRP